MDGITMTDSAKPDDQKLIAEAIERYQQSEDYESENRKAALDDLKFVNGEQWPDAIKRQREIEFRPCQTINKLPAFIRQVTNDSRQNRPCIKVHPVDSSADVDTAEVLQGLIKHIEYDSNADVAYDTALESAARIGFGYWRILTEYQSPTSFDQVIKIRRIRNAFMVRMDPNAQEPDGSDARWGMIVDDMPRALFKMDYPNAEASDFEAASSGEAVKDWFGGETIRVAEYFRVEESPATLLLLSDGTITYKDDLPALPPGLVVLNERQSTRHKVCWYKITGCEVLDRREWPGRWIPIVPMYGDEVDIEGKVTRSGLVRFSKDAQRMYNYWKTTETELIALAPKAPYIGVEGQFEGHEDKWETANTVSYPYLEYVPVSLGGQLAPAPARQPFAGPPAGVITAALSASDDIKATTGIYDASLGSRSNETSGKAIMARQREGDVGNFHYTDNQARSLRHTGRILIDLIPHIYDSQRVVRIIGEDGKADVAELNKPLDPPKTDPNTGAIKTVLNDMKMGIYDVTVSVGPSYNTQRQEAAEAMTQMAQSWPELMNIAGDKVIGAMDWPGADEISERIKRSIPPNLLGEEEKPEQQQLPPEVEAHMQQMQQYIQELEQHVQETESGLQKAQLDSETKIEIAHINNEGRKDIEELKGVIQMLIQKMQPPPLLANEVGDDLSEDEQHNPPSAGFFTPEENLAPQTDQLDQAPNMVSQPDAQDGL
jgi:hypothetical protein